MPRYLAQQSLPRASGQASAGVLVGTAFKRLLISPQAGVLADGTLPETIEEQVSQAFDNMLALLGAAGLEARDIVRLTVHSAVPGSADLCSRIRDTKIAPARPAYAYREVAGFGQLHCLVEVDIEAVREAGS